jgi:2-oxoglutarate dehydrogenase E2 component (dihydrolipoamide succinyltransferase)
MATDVVMPQMGESIAEGTIVRWIKKVGEKVDRDEPLFEISTDKVDAENPSPAAVSCRRSASRRRDGPVNSVVGRHRHRVRPLGGQAPRRVAARLRRAPGRTKAVEPPTAVAAGGRLARIRRADRRAPRRPRSQTRSDGARGPDGSASPATAAHAPLSTKTRCTSDRRRS